MVRKSGDRVRIYTRRGADWTKRFPRITETVRSLKVESVLIDGEGVVCDHGLAIFDRLHSKLNGPVCLRSARTEWRRLPAGVPHERKSRLRKLLRNRANGILYNDHRDRAGF